MSSLRAYLENALHVHPPVGGRTCGRLLGGWAVLILAACLLLAPPPPALSQTPPRLRFAPDRLTLDQGAAAVVEIQAQGVQDLAAFELDLALDPTLVAVERVERVIGTAAQPTPGRTWTSLPLDASAGYVQLGPGRISFGGFSYGADSPPGAAGDVTLARVALRAVRPGQTSLTLPRALLTDTNAQPSTPTVGQAVVSVTGQSYLLYLPHFVKGGPVAAPKP